VVSRRVIPREATAVHLSELLDRYALVRSIQRNSEYQLRHSLRAFESWLGRAAGERDLADVAVSRFLQVSAETLGQRSVANLRTNLLCLWRFAADERLVAQPGRVRKVSRPDPMPIAWTLEELARVVNRCGELRGTFKSGAPRALYCRTLCLFAYDSGLRRSDVWVVRRNQIREDGTIVLRQHKTGRTHTPRIRGEALRGFSELPGDPPLRCPMSSTGDWYQFWRDEVIKPAGVRQGALQQIRRTGASWLAIDHPEAVQRYLGHKSATMQRHYVDESIARPQAFLPPLIPS
jgi:integrase